MISSMIFALLMSQQLTKNRSNLALDESKLARPMSHNIDIPFEKFVLENGLTLIVHEDHRLPVVAVNVWYHVGSKNERSGKTGFAHLFEHLMFNGSEHYKDDFFKPLEAAGATDMNGTTSNDRTNYFENVPTSALDLALWMESDRMAHMLGGIDQKTLDEQRGVVQNEKRQSENEPYGIAEELITRGTYPQGHPYSWTVIGSMEDLNAASLEDVKQWFKSYYGAANAVLVLAGDITPQKALEKVRHYFGEVPPGPPVARFRQWPAKIGQVRRQAAEDRVPQARVYKVWNIPGSGTSEETLLSLASDVLGSGKNSRFYQRLVREDQSASDVTAVIDSREISSQFYVIATVKPGESLQKVETAIEEEMQAFFGKGPTAKELKRIKAQYTASLLNGLQRLGGFGGRSDLLAYGEVFHGDPHHYKKQLEQVKKATADQLRQTAKEWLALDNQYVLEIHPFGDPKPVASVKPDRQALPVVGDPPLAKFPDLQETFLPNGLRVLLAEQHALPLLRIQLVANGGFSADALAAPGTASLTMAMLDEGTKNRSGKKLHEELEELGAQLSAEVNLDQLRVDLFSLKENLPASLELMADAALNPSFPAADFEREKKLQLDAIEREKAHPEELAFRILPTLLYGAGHPYAMPFSGHGYAATVKKLEREDIIHFYRNWFKANNATLIVVGDTTLKEVVPLLKQHFGDWAKGTTPALPAPVPKSAPGGQIYLIDRPGSQQSYLIAGQLMSKATPDDKWLALQMVNRVLGGNFISRLNLNLRENKHWTYGAYSYFQTVRGIQPFFASTSVQTDKTKEALQELSQELLEIRATRPITTEEFEFARRNRLLELAGSWETQSALSREVNYLLRLGFPLDYYNSYAERLKRLSLEQMRQEAAKALKPENIIYMVVGDRAKVETELRTAKLGPVTILDAEELKPGTTEVTSVDTTKN